MKTLTLTYKLIPESIGFSVKCLDWKAIFTEGDNYKECKKNAIEVTELFLDRFQKKELHLAQFPKLKKHLPNPFQFQLTFDIKKCKFIEVEKVKFLNKLEPDSM